MAIKIGGKSVVDLTLAFVRGECYAVWFYVTDYRRYKELKRDDELIKFEKAGLLVFVDFDPAEHRTKVLLVAEEIVERRMNDCYANKHRLDGSYYTD